ncbi:MAG: type III pantothenate kinase [Deltaproteobacteria bacterium]|nr:type III pantothenate kinase [Deltaproteobacteria bacterium]
MLLVIDIGNTHTVLGIADEELRGEPHRIASDTQAGTGVYERALQQYVEDVLVEGERITGVSIAGVVPALTRAFSESCTRLFGVEPLIVDYRLDLGIMIDYERPELLGIDRVVNAVAAYGCFQQSVLIIDFGTATTFDLVSSDGHYRGGAIAPGLKTAGEALWTCTAKLPRVEFSAPDRAVAKNTTGCMQSGIMFGYAGLVDGLVGRMQAETAQKSLVVATGGLAPAILPLSAVIDAHEPLLMLQGLKIIYDRNHKKMRA